MKLLPSPVPVCLLLSALSASATVFVDPLGDSLVPSGHAMDIASVSVTDDGSTLFFGVALGDSAGFAADAFARLMIGFDTRPGGSSTANAWSDQYRMPGMDFFLGGSGVDFNVHSAALGGWPEWQNAGSGSTWVHYGTVTLDGGALRFSVPFTALGLSPGDSFSFDVVTAWSNPGHAIDAAGRNDGSSTQSSWSTVAYDSGTSVLTYTTAIPEPSVAALLAALAAAGVLVLRRRRA